MNHTPGPWRVTYHGFQMVKVENKDRVIFDGFHGEEANAALAAAAPDLFSALVRAKEWMACDEDNWNEMTEHDQQVYTSTMEAINNAIRKAKGQ